MCVALRFAASLNWLPCCILQKHTWFSVCMCALFQSYAVSSEYHGANTRVRSTSVRAPVLQYTYERQTEKHNRAQQPVLASKYETHTYARYVRVYQWCCSPTPSSNHRCTSIRLPQVQQHKGTKVHTCRGTRSSRSITLAPRPASAGRAARGQAKCTPPCPRPQL